MSQKVRDLLDVTKIQGGYGNVSTATLNVMRGINHRGAGNIVPANRDYQGLTFFTRPNLNLSLDNLMQSRRLTYLTNTDPKSMACAIRCLLSPEVADNWNMSVMPTDPRLPRSLVIDDKYPFIPVLTNTLISLSGWPDMVLEAFTSKEGLRKETISWADSIADLYTSFDLSANFQNMEGDPITALFSSWIEYAGRVASGDMDPYGRCIIENEIDYQTRIYRIVLDPTKTQVRKIAEVGIAFPSAVPLGAAFNYSSENLFNTETDQLGIRFTCTGVRYNDPITVVNFNRTVQTFNSGMRDGRRAGEMELVSTQEIRLFNYMGYPRISEDNVLEWWVPKSDYSQLKSTLNL